MSVVGLAAAWAACENAGASFAGPLVRFYIKAPNSDAGDAFGSAVAVDGNTLVIGAPGEDSSSTQIDGSAADNSAPDAGAVYVFVRSGSTWTLQAYLKADNAGAGDGFGATVAVKGDTIVVGAPGEDSDSAAIQGDGSNNSASEAGAAYVFVRSGTTWSQQAYLKASNSESGDGFGRAVGIDGDLVVIGADGEDSSATTNGDEANNAALDAGAAYVFTRLGTVWTKGAYLKANNAAAGASFGRAVSISGRYVLVGSPREDATLQGVQQRDSGAAYVFFQLGTGVWQQQGYLKPLDSERDDFLGSAVACSGDTFVFGGPGDDERASAAGGARVYTRSGTTYSEQGRLTASDGQGQDQFGTAVALDGDSFLVGAPFEDTPEADTGAAYLFLREFGVWTQQPILRAITPGADDRFGFATALRGDLIAVGAPGEDSNADTIGGDQGDNSAPEAGAVVVFMPASVLPVGGNSFAITEILPVDGGDVRIEWNSSPGTTYAVEYSNNLTTWIRVVPTVAAGANRTQWIDNGPPKTSAHPSTVTKRFYRIVQLP